VVYLSLDRLRPNRTKGAKEMHRIIDLNKPIKALVTEYPEIIDIMKRIGFESITNPAMLNTAGRVMTLVKGAKMKNIDLEIVKSEFIQSGFEVKE
jgi:hypothetical protein